MDATHRPGVRAAGRAAALVAVGLLLLVALPSDPAAAHVYLTDTVPAAGAELDASPGEIVLTYDGRVTPAGNALTVIDEVGSELRLDAEEGADPGQLRAGIREELDAGEYRVVWRVLPADGHVLEGEFTFTIAPGTRSPETTVPAATETGPTLPEWSDPTVASDTAAGTASNAAASERMEVVGAVGDEGSWAGALALLAAVAVVAAGLVRMGRRTAPAVSR